MAAQLFANSPLACVFEGLLPGGARAALFPAALGTLGAAFGKRAKGQSGFGQLAVTANPLKAPEAEEEKPLQTAKLKSGLFKARAELCEAWSRYLPNCAAALGFNRLWVCAAFGSNLAGDVSERVPGVHDAVFDKDVAGALTKAGRADKIKPWNLGAFKGFRV